MNKIPAARLNPAPTGGVSALSKRKGGRLGYLGR